MMRLKISDWICIKNGAGFLVGLVIFCAAASCVHGQEAEEYPAPKLNQEMLGLGPNLQRTMRLLATSTPEHRNTVRVLFYGQSITEQGWWKLVAEDLRRRFPHANLLIENRAIGGHSSQLLVKTAETDLYPFQPDLVIFHVYGAHDAYERIISGIRSRTTAEILQQNDHVTRPEDLTEETDPAKLPPSGAHWNAFMNHNWLPHVSAKYGTQLCDQRSVWKRYLQENHLEPSALLKDGVHLNAWGEYLMAECVKAYLRYEPALGRSPAEGWVRDIDVTETDAVVKDRLHLDFTGSRVDAILKEGAEAEASILVDGKKPSEHAGCYTFTRASAYPGMNWPCLLRVRSQALLEPEEWTAELSSITPECGGFHFRVSGSETGFDGEGEASARFVSNSGRLVIEPDDWNMAYARKVSQGFRPGAKPLEDGFKVTFRSVLLGRDSLSVVGDAEPGIERTVTLVQGLPNEKHALEVRGPGCAAIKAFRVYSPPEVPAP